MVVIASRQAGERPETIRTRLARFMPSRAAAGWSIGWSASTDRPEDISDEDQLRAAEHIGCFGAAVEHALAQANVAATRLSLTAGMPASTDGSPQPITVEVRAQIPGIPADVTILETVLRRVEAPCATWKALAAEAGVHVTGILEDGVVAAAEEAPNAPVAAPKAAPMPRSGPRFGLPFMPIGLSVMPPWLTLRVGALTAVAIAGLAFVAHH